MELIICDDFIDKLRINLDSTWAPSEDREIECRAQRQDSTRTNRATVYGLTTSGNYTLSNQQSTRGSALIFIARWDAASKMWESYSLTPSYGRVYTNGATTTQAMVPLDAWNVPSTVEEWERLLNGTATP